MQINNIVSLQSLSTEVNFYNKAEPLGRPKEALVRREYAYKALGLKGKVVMATENAAFIRDTPLYTAAGKHSVVVTITPSKQSENLF